jgi:ribulose-phosphate 3-epimerase
MQIVPAILEKTPQDFKRQIDRLRPYFNYFQIDVADGLFVPNKTLIIEKIISSLITTDSRLVFDFHLMVKNYEEEIKKLVSFKKRVNLKNVFVHYSLFPKYLVLKSRYRFITIGLVINPEDQISDLEQKYDLKSIDVLQIMSVKPGFQGQPFIPKTLNKIERLRKLGYRNKIYLDGGINEKTLPIILKKKYQPDFLCVGCFLTKNTNLENKLRVFKKNYG